MKIVTIIGARPQFIKAAVVSRAIRNVKGIKEVIVHTGQHFDENMSDIFFSELEIPKPDYNLEINGLGHGAMTGQMLEKLEGVLLVEKPTLVLVYGDTNSTLAGALAAKKLGIKIAHVEAGLRSFNMQMPEEINRILTDRISDLLFCPTDLAMLNLEKEGLNNDNNLIVNVGDVMLDAALFYADKAKKPKFDLPDKYILSTIHRAENTDNSDALRNIFDALEEISSETTVVMPIHPRTRNKLKTYDFDMQHSKIKFIDPVGYLEMVYLLKNCQLVMTDSGGLQKEAYFYKKQCITLREETEWVELLDYGYNKITGSSYSKIIESYEVASEKNDLIFNGTFYGHGNAGIMIVSHIQKYNY